MPFKGCLSDACVLMKIERFVLKPLRKIERFVLKQHTFRFADYTQAMALSLPMVHFSTAFGRGRSKELTILPLCFITKKNMKTRIQT